MKITTADIIFYISTLAGALALFAKLATSLVSNAALLWVGIISLLLDYLAYQFYEKINGTTTPPTPPLPPAPAA